MYSNQTSAVGMEHRPVLGNIPDTRSMTASESIRRDRDFVPVRETLETTFKNLIELRDSLSRIQAAIRILPETNAVTGGKPADSTVFSLADQVREMVAVCGALSRGIEMHIGV